MIGEDLSVWLLEINCSPAMGASTQVTKQFCAEVMEDTLKVVIDRKENKTACTGSFELAVRQVGSKFSHFFIYNISRDKYAIFFIKVHYFGAFSPLKRLHSTWMVHTTLYYAARNQLLMHIVQVYFFTLFRNSTKMKIFHFFGMGISFLF